MKKCRRPVHRKVLSFERCEVKLLPTLVFVLNGNAFAAAAPDSNTADAAAVLRAAGEEAIQLAYPDINSPGAFYGLAKQIKSLSHGEPIGIVGFSAGGALAERLAGVRWLHVTDVLADYSPPDLKDYLAYHGDDKYSQYVLGHINDNSAVIDLFSGPNDTQAHVVTAFGHDDHDVVASQSTTSFHQDYPDGQVYYYPGPHGVGIGAGGSAALDDFLAHLPTPGHH